MVLLWAAFFPFGSCWNISPLLLSPVTTGNRPCLVLFTAKLHVLLSKSSVQTSYVLASKPQRPCPGQF